MRLADPGEAIGQHNRRDGTYALTAVSRGRLLANVERRGDLEGRVSLVWEGERDARRRGSQVLGQRTPERSATVVLDRVVVDVRVVLWRIRDVRWRRTKDEIGVHELDRNWRMESWWGRRLWWWRGSECG